MSMSEAMRQMPAPAGRAGAARGEAVRESASDEAEGPRREPSDTGKSDGFTPALMTSTSRTARCGPAAGWCGRGPVSDDRPLSRCAPSMGALLRVQVPP